VKRLLVVAMIPAALILAGCSTTHSVGDSTHAGMGSAMPSASHDMPHSSDFDAADVMFAQMMIPHHEQAVEMSTFAVDRASDPAITRLAATIKAAQEPEINQMTTWLQAADAPITNDHMGHGMPGLLTDQQMLDLEGATGSAFDQMFAMYMIVHHEGAIEMAQQVVESANSDVASLAKSIIAEQTVEIEELKAFLAN